MLFNATVLASLMGISLILLFKKLPKRLRDFCLKHPLLMDIVVTFGLISSFGTTATVIIAAAMVDAIIGCAIYVANNPTDYQFLFDFYAMIGDMLKKLRTTLTEFGRSYNAQKLAEQQVVTNG